MSFLSTYKTTKASTATDNVLCELLIVGGGGNSSNSESNSITGGGGGGQVKYFYNIKIPKGLSQVITVGAAGNSSVFGSITAGAGYNGAGGNSGNAAGGSGGVSTDRGGGGGGSVINSTGTRAEGKGGGLKYSTEVTNALALDLVHACFLSQGYDGGVPYGVLNEQYSGGGGGAGGNSILVGTKSSGGIGYSSGITNTLTAYGTGGEGRLGFSSSNGVNGGSNSGDGASGARGSGGLGATGGSGIVIIAYPNTYAAPTSITGTYTTPTRTGYRVYQFTGSGSITL